MELNQSTVSVGVTCEVDMGDYQLRFKRTLREGATAEMRDETLRHLKYAARLLRDGAFKVETEEATKRTKYSETPHGEPRVVLFGDLYVKGGKGWYEVLGLKITEYTSTQDILNMVLLNLEDGIAVTTNVTPFPHQQSQPDQGQNPGRANQSGNQQQPADGSTPPRQLKKLEKGTQLVNGEWVSVTVVKIAHSSSKQGVGMWEFFNPYGVNPGQHPSHMMTLYADNEMRMESVGDFLEGLNLQMGSSITGRWNYIGQIIIKPDDLDKDGNPKRFINVKEIVEVNSG